MICRICDSTKLTPVLDLGLQPWANNFLPKEAVGKEEKYPLRLFFCEDCSCVQLDYTVPKETMFGDHTYVSGTTKTLAKHFYDTGVEVAKLVEARGAPQTILDIGSNDGTQLAQYQKLGFQTVGVESCRRIGEMAQAAGIETVIDYFNEDSARALKRKFGVINASGVFFHLEELHSAARGVKNSLEENGVFVIQFLYMKSIVENLAFDQVYHEHLLYYTVDTVTKLLKRHGLAPFDAYLSPIHGGSIILFSGHDTGEPESARLKALRQSEEDCAANSRQYFEEFSKRVVKMKRDTLAFLDRTKAEGKTIYGFGAPVKGNTFLNYCGIGTQYLDCLVEKNPLRKGLYSPGMHIPIVLEDEIEKQPNVYLVLAWNFKREILKNNQSLVDQGVEFYFPVNPAE